MVGWLALQAYYYILVPTIVSGGPVEDVRAVVGLITSIFFEVKANPPVQHRVLERVGSSLEVPSSISLSSTQEGGIIITNPGKDDGGTYRFIAFNNLGMGSKEFTIVVDCKLLP